MNSRSVILERIKQNKPEQVPLPDLDIFHYQISEEELIADFIKNSTINMSSVINLIRSGTSLENYIEELISKNFPEATAVYDTSKVTEKAQEVDFSKNINLFISEAKLGVAENACLWFDDSKIRQRLSLFACEHTILIINHKNIVPTMHQAYQNLKINEQGYGVFIAGPSKTADIEQSLVVGAQGAVSNTIILI